MKGNLPIRRSPDAARLVRPVTPRGSAGRAPAGLLALGLALSRGAFAADVIVPPQFAGTEGDVSEVSLLGRQDNRVQIVYSASLLGLSGLQAGDSIFGLTFRLDGDEPLELPAQTVSSYSITLGTPTHPPGSLELTFANNLGPDAQTVRSGPLVVSAGDFEAVGSPRSFGVSIIFQNAYVYQGGALLLDLSHSLFPQGGRSVDAVSTLSGADMQSLFGTPGSSLADLGSALGAGPVLGLTLSQVPETRHLPTVCGLGCAGWLVARRIRVRR